MAHKQKQATLRSFKEFFSQGGSDCPTRELMPMGKEGELKDMQHELALEAEKAEFKGVYSCVVVEEK